MIWDVLLELSHSKLKISEFLDISKRNTERIDEHRDDTEMKVECFSDGISEPTDQVTEEPDPHDCHQKGQGVIRLVTF